MRKLSILILLLFTNTSGLHAQERIFEGVKIHRHRSADNRVLVDKIGALAFDDTARKLTFKSHAGDNIAVGYDDVVKVVFEVTAHMRGGVLAETVPFIGIAIAAEHVNDYWFYLAYKDREVDKSLLLEVPKNFSAQVINKANDVFGSRVTIAKFAETGIDIKKEQLKGIKSKQVLKVDKRNHPLPELKPDMATVLVVCPSPVARYAGRGTQFKLHANDQVVAVNLWGTYSFAYLRPGKYRLVSQAENANGFDMKLKADHEYFFLQNTFMGNFKPHTTLSRDSPELVMYFAGGSYLADWKPKAK
jgi:hypothetical protein